MVGALFDGSGLGATRQVRLRLHRVPASATEASTMVATRNVTVATFRAVIQVVIFCWYTSATPL